MTRINEIEGIGAVYSKKLEAAGIESVEAFFRKRQRPKAVERYGFLSLE
jgi:hypothetical protein